MRQAFEKVSSTYETVKKSVQKRLEGFKNKFEGTKTEMSQEVMKAESHEDLIALGKKLQEQGEALKEEKEGIEPGEDIVESLESDKNAMIENAHEEALVENEKFDETKVAEEERIQAGQDAERIAEIREVINSDSAEVSGEQKEITPEQKMDEYIEKFKKINAEHGTYSLIFQTMRDNKDIDFLNNDKMIVHYVKEMGIDSISYLNSFCSYKKKFSKELIIDIINALPESNASDLYKGGYHELAILADSMGLGKDSDVVEAIVRKNSQMAYELFNQGNAEERKISHIIMTEGPDAYYKK